jgi:hypothetical protein
MFEFFVVDSKQCFMFLCYVDVVVQTFCYSILDGTVWVLY